MVATDEPFDAAKHLTQLKRGYKDKRGNWHETVSDYLEVKWRIAWLRDKHPDAEIDTELVRLEDNMAVFKATVSVPGGGRATGYGSEEASDFGDFLEKAETKAMGRALAALGFGTQFCSDFDFSEGRSDGEFAVVDAPVQKPAARQRTAPARRQQATQSQIDGLRQALSEARETIWNHPGRARAEIDFFQERCPAILKEVDGRTRILPFIMLTSAQAGALLRDLREVIKAYRSGTDEPAATPSPEPMTPVQRETLRQLLIKYPNLSAIYIEEIGHADPYNATATAADAKRAIARALDYEERSRLPSEASTEQA